MGHCYGLEVGSGNYSRWESMGWEGEGRAVAVQWAEGVESAASVPGNLVIEANATDGVMGNYETLGEDPVLRWKSPYACCCIGVRKARDLLTRPAAAQEA